MSRPSVDAAPQGTARTIGALYLLVIVLGGFSEFHIRAAVVPGDDALTVRHILASPSLWQLSAAASLVVPLIAAVQKWLEYRLLRPVSRDIALLNLIPTLLSLAIEAVSKVFLLAVLPLLQHSGSNAPSAQLQALALLALDLRNIAFTVALVFFGAACLVCGYLVFCSGYLPKAIGLLLQAAGAGYFVITFVALFAPACSAQTMPVFALILAGETAYCLWLLMMGVNKRKWLDAQRPLTDG